MRLNPSSVISIDISATRAIAMESEWGAEHSDQRGIIWQRSVGLAGAAALERGELDGLAPLLAGVRDRIGRRFVPVRVSLADPLVRSRVYLLDDAVQRSAELQALAAWRLRREFGTTELRCVAQHLGDAGGRHLVLAAAIPLAVAVAIEHLFDAHELAPEAVVPVTLDRLHRHRDQLQPASGWLVVDSDCWSLCVLDEQQRPRLLRARWREQVSQEDIAADVTRVLRAYAAQAPDLSLSALHVSASAGELPVVAEALEQLLPGAWQSLPINDVMAADVAEEAP